MLNQTIYAVSNSIKIDKRPSIQLDDKEISKLLTNSANYFITEDLAVSYALTKLKIGFDIIETYPIYEVNVKPSINKNVFFEVTHILSAKIYLNQYNFIDMPLNFEICTEQEKNKSCSHFVSSNYFIAFFPPPKNKLLYKDLPCTPTNFTDYYKLQPIRQALTFLCVANNKIIAEQKLPQDITHTICRNILGIR